MSSKSKKASTPYPYLVSLKSTELLNLCEALGVQESTSLRALISQKELGLNNTQVCKLMCLNRVTYHRYMRTLNERIRKGIGA